MKYKRLLFFALTALLFIEVWSQQAKQATISGIVKDAKTKLPIADAVITVSSSTFKGQKFTLTNAEGLYKINNLPSGNYTISFEMEGYKKSTRDGLALKDGMSFGVDSEMMKERK